MAAEYKMMDRCQLKELKIIVGVDIFSVHLSDQVELFIFSASDPKLAVLVFLRLRAGSYC